MTSFNPLTFSEPALVAPHLYQSLQILILPHILLHHTTDHFTTSTRCSLAPLSQLPS